MKSLCTEPLSTIAIPAVTRGRALKCAVVILTLAGVCRSANATVYGGVDFPQGAASFADAVVSYTPGTNPTPDAAVSHPDQALGPPNYPSGTNDPAPFVSLGSNGVLVLQFTDNLLTGSGTTNDDLWIFEIGTGIEKTFVDVSIDGSTWFSVGEANGSTDGVDLDAFGFGPLDMFSYVRITDHGDNFYGAGTPGADIDAVGAISTVVVPEPATWSLLALSAIALLCFRRR